MADGHGRVYTRRWKRTVETERANTSARGTSLPPKKCLTGVSLCCAHHKTQGGRANVVVSSFLFPWLTVVMGESQAERRQRKEGGGDEKKASSFSLSLSLSSSESLFFLCVPQSGRRLSHAWKRGHRSVARWGGHCRPCPNQSRADYYYYYYCTILQLTKQKATNESNAQFSAL